MKAEQPTGKRQRTKYAAAFRAGAVRRGTQNGQTTTRIAQALGMLHTRCLFLLDDLSVATELADEAARRPRLPAPLK